MKNIQIKIYKFKELNNNIQEKIINNYINELIEITDFLNLNKNTSLYKAFKKCEEMQTPWFLSQYIWDYCQKQILKDIKQEEFFENGDLY